MELQRNFHLKQDGKGKEYQKNLLVQFIASAGYQTQRMAQNGAM